MNYYMGIDNGGTLCKAVLFDSAGKYICSASEELVMLTPDAGHTERDMEELWQANCRIVRKVAEGSGIDPKDIKGAACSGHGKGLYLWGKNGKPAMNGIVSTDSRAWEYPERWARDGTVDKVFEKTYQKILACQPVSLLCWIRDNKPEVFSNIMEVFEVKDYIRFRLTGNANAELTDISGSNLLNLKTRQYDKELLSLYGLDSIWEFLPPLKGSFDVCGRITSETAKLTGLTEDTVIAGGMFDIDACAIAMDITNDENIAVIAGTWSINEYISKRPVLNKSVMMNSLYCMEGYYLVEECSPTSAGNLKWFMEMFMPDVKSYREFDKLSESVAPDGQNLIFLPYVFGSNYNPQAKATLLGLDSHHTKNHIARAILEGVCFCHKVHIEKLLQNRKTTKAIRLAGGAAKSSLWTQLFADILELPIELVEGDELGALGCAMAAAVAAGEYSDIENAAKSMVKIKTRVAPNPKTFEAYRKKYKLYQDVSDRLDSYWKKI
ncbi:MAG: carbohydrate kinase [Oscillospiraceae bacterium]|nr:carbohydrate kinase [Oscillospiraceae bacterium]